MKASQTSIVPIKFSSVKDLDSFRNKCIQLDILSPYDSFSGQFNLRSVKDINTNDFSFYYLKNTASEAQCAFRGESVILIVTMLSDFEDYYPFIGSALKSRAQFVKDTLSCRSSDPYLRRFLLLACQGPLTAKISYVFTFFSIFDPNFSEKKTIHTKVLAEPSIISSDDMLCTELGEQLYNRKTTLDQSIANKIHDIDLDSDQWSFITWASVVTIAKKEDEFVKTHLLTILIEMRTQYIWNLCFSQSESIERLITRHRITSSGTTEAVAESYRILLEAKSSISATFSSRISLLHRAIVETSQLNVITESLEQKINYLISLADIARKEATKRATTVSEILLFIVAVAQIFPIFFEMPLVSQTITGILSISVLCILGILLIIRKHRNGNV